jgi:hypothetical protein
MTTEKGATEKDPESLKYGNGQILTAKHTRDNSGIFIPKTIKISALKDRLVCELQLLESAAFPG